MKSVAVFSYLSFFTAEAQEDLPGSCPKVLLGWDQEKKGRLDLQRLSGTWLNAYDHGQDEDVECVSVKLVQMENAT